MKRKHRGSHRVSHRSSNINVINLNNSKRSNVVRGRARPSAPAPSNPPISIHVGGSSPGFIPGPSATPPAKAPDVNVSVNAAPTVQASPQQTSSDNSNMWENFANNALFAGLMMMSGGRAAAAERAVVGETAAAANAERAAVATAETQTEAAAVRQEAAGERREVAIGADAEPVAVGQDEPAQPAVVNAPGYGQPVEIINPDTPFNPDASFTRTNPPPPRENLSLERGEQGVAANVPTIEMTDFKTPARTGSRATSRAASRTRTPAEAKEAETYIGSTNIPTMRELATTRGQAGVGISSTSTTSRQQGGRKRGKRTKTEDNTVIDGSRFTEGITGRTRGQQKKQSLASQVAEFFRNMRRGNSSGYTPIQSPQNTGNFVQMAEGSRYQASPSLLSYP